MNTYEDWRDAPASDIRALFDREASRWRRALGWDYRHTCAALEEARAAGRLPGRLARTRDGRVAGWTYFVLQNRQFQIGSLVGDDRSTIQGLLSSALRSPEARAAAGVSCFVFPAGSEVAPALSHAGLDVRPHAYLSLKLGPAAARASDLAQASYSSALWAVGRVTEVAELLAAAYGTMAEARCFAPTGCPSEWVAYLSQIVHTPACGRFDAELTHLLTDGNGRAAAALVATRLSETTAHIAQVVVAAAHRRRGLGAYLVREACRRAQAAGYEQVTLIVAESNLVARRLYERLGFQQVAGFLFGSKEEGKSVKEEG